MFTGLIISQSDIIHYCRYTTLFADKGYYSTQLYLMLVVYTNWFTGEQLTAVLLYTVLLWRGICCLVLSNERDISRYMYLNYSMAGKNVLNKWMPLQAANKILSCLNIQQQVYWCFTGHYLLLLDICIHVLSSEIDSSSCLDNRMTVHSVTSR
jgi:hypothetical protein